MHCKVQCLVARNEVGEVSDEEDDLKDDQSQSENSTSLESNNNPQTSQYGEEEDEKGEGMSDRISRVKPALFGVILGGVIAGIFPLFLCDRKILFCVFRSTWSDFSSSFPPGIH